MPDLQQSINALRILTECHCEPAWTDRRLHNVDCHAEDREDLDVLLARLARLAEVEADHAKLGQRYVRVMTQRDALSAANFRLSRTNGDLVAAAEKDYANACGERDAYRTKMLELQAEMDRARPVVEAADPTRSTTWAGSYIEYPNGERSVIGQWDMVSRTYIWRPDKTMLQQIAARVDALPDGPPAPLVSPLSPSQPELVPDSTDGVGEQGAAPLPWHVGRAWAGHDIEDTCPCPQEPCGLVEFAKADPSCEHHPASRARSIRQSHRAADCPGPGEADWKAMYDTHFPGEVDDDQPTPGTCRTCDMFSSSDTVCTSCGVPLGPGRFNGPEGVSGRALAAMDETFAKAFAGESVDAPPLTAADIAVTAEQIRAANPNPAVDVEKLQAEIAAVEPPLPPMPPEAWTRAVDPDLSPGEMKIDGKVIRYEPADPPWLEEAIEAAGRALVPFGDDDEPDYFEYHRCTDKSNCSPPCSCSGMPWPSKAVQAAIRAALPHITGGVLTEAADDWRQQHEHLGASTAYRWLRERAARQVTS